MEDFRTKYFLAAISCEGFFSAFDESYDADDGWKAFIIKGGPGTGKSSFMKYVAAKATGKGLKIELCPCSSDPNSLDAVIIPEKKIAIMDGTAPHIVDPKFPGVCEKILNFGDFWNDDEFYKYGEEILSITKINKNLHKTASRYLFATGQIIMDNFKTASACTDNVKTLAYAKKLCRRYVPGHNGKGREWTKFIEGITPLGIVSYSNTVLANTDTQVIINDDYGSASNIIMNYIRDFALKSGYEIITLKNPFLPSLLIDHIIIPELSLAFVTENEYMHFNTTVRRIHARRFVNSKQLHNSRERMKFNRKAVRQLLLSAAATLNKAKDVHDELESYYIKSMNFDALTLFAANFVNKIL